MIEYTRKYPLFALCGLNCGLCSRYHTDGTSKCPGCGGPDFHLLHPSCAVITCNRKHDNVEYCFQCSLYPCEKYKKPSEVDSFITYKNVLDDFASAKKDLSLYRKVLNEKVKILSLLLDQYNDGKRKNFYCLTVNLLPLDDLKKIVHQIKANIDTQEMDQKAKASQIAALLYESAQKRGLEIELRK